MTYVSCLRNGALLDWKENMGYLTPTKSFHCHFSQSFKVFLICFSSFVLCHETSQPAISSANSFLFTYLFCKTIYFCFCLQTCPCSTEINNGPSLIYNTKMFISYQNVVVMTQTISQTIQQSQAFLSQFGVLSRHVLFFQQTHFLSFIYFDKIIFFFSKDIPK